MSEPQRGCHSLYNIQNTYIRYAHVPKHNFETKLLRRKAVCALFKMVTGNARKRVRFTLDVTFPTAKCKLVFLARLMRFRDAMTSPGAAKLDNCFLSLKVSQPYQKRAGKSTLFQEMFCHRVVSVAKYMYVVCLFLHVFLEVYTCTYNNHPCYTESVHDFFTI